MKYKIAIFKSDEGYAASVPGLPGCRSQGESEAEALENIKEAILDYLAVVDQNTESADISEVEVDVAMPNLPGINYLNSVRDPSSIFAWYFGAFIVAALLWHLSASVRSIDVLELPMAVFYFPLAGIIDPHDGMVNDRNSFFGGVAFWGAVLALSFKFTPRRFNPLIVAFAIIGVCSATSVIYVVLRAMFAQPVVCIG